MSPFDTPFAQAIAALGKTPETITKRLRAKGIKGYRRVASACPIANYLKACGFPNVTVATSAGRYTTDRQHDSDESIALPEGVKKWITDFDDGKYPEFYLE